MKTLAHQIEPARCTKTFTFDQFNQLLEDDLKGMLADEKFDGRRYFHQIRPNKAKHNYVTSRRVSKTSGVMVEKQDSMPFFRDCLFGPKDSVYDGEMCNPNGGSSHEAATAIANDTAIFRVFDVVRFNGVDVRNRPQKERWAMLDLVRPELPKRMVIVPRSRNPRRLLNAVRFLDGEGIILKLPDAEYGDGWFKVVSVENYDVVVVGFEMSTSEKYGPKGWIKGIKFAQWVPFDPRQELPAGTHAATSGKGQPMVLKQIGQTSGFNEKLRAEISKNPDKFMGRVMTLRAKGRELSGALRHPRFDSWHPDKNPKECIWVK